MTFSNSYSSTQTSSNCRHTKIFMVSLTRK